MKTSNLVKTFFSAVIIACFAITAQAKTITTTLSADTGKMSKMSKMDKKKMDKKMDKKMGKKMDKKMEKTPSKM